MVRTWTSLVHRAHVSAQSLGEMAQSSASRAYVSTQSLLARTVPTSVHRVQVSAQLLGELVRKAQSVVPPAHISAKVWGEIALAAVLLVTLAFSWRDGVPSNGFDDALAATQSAVRVEVLPGEQPAFGLTLPGLRNVPAWAKTTGELVSTRALIPTAPPVQLLIPSLNVHRPVEAVGVNRARVMDLPVNAWNAGWFKDGPVPGAPGDAVIEGHAGYPDQPMIFGKLATLRPGDQIIVVLSDGSKRLFLVDSMATLPVGSAPAGIASTNGPARLTLITCTGSFNDKTFSYSKRLLVEARYAGTV
jgi:LPXTG-site transpeptidase (sortase) family protein